ncbi:MAG: NAD-dependent epimerase/dehydratase family protein [Deltaproteobacteria bacterium]|nr:NAD-dependent epimerase/dehydratase family protein [Deltaproteobacteria bacterium]
MSAEGKIEQPVLVTGATGFIGSRVVYKLLQNGIPVKVLALPDEATPSEWTEKVEIVRGSISDSHAVEEAAKGAKTIIHLVAIVTDWGDEKKYWEFTVEGSRLIFEQAVKNKARVVLASSIVVYGDKIYSQSCPEETAYGKTFGPYSRTKQAQEKLAWDYYKNKGMRLTVVRPANVYGPRSGPWLHDVINVLKSGSPGLISGGNMNAGLAYVDNVADILILAASTENTIGRAYNASDGMDVTWKQYFTDIADMIGVKNPKSIPRPLAAFGAYLLEGIFKLFSIQKRPPITREALNLVGSDNRIPIDRVKNELGYTPQVSYAEGLKKIKEYIDKELK